MVPFAPPPDVTLGMPEDEESLMDLLRQRHAEEGDSDFDDQAVRDRVQCGLFRTNGNIGVIRKNGIVEASIGLYFTSFWYSKSKHLADYWNYVRPDYRRSTHAKHLIMFAKAYADALNIPLIMAKIKTADTEPMLRLYERQMSAGGTIFTYRRLKVEA